MRTIMSSRQTGYSARLAKLVEEGGGKIGAEYL